MVKHIASHRMVNTDTVSRLTNSLKEEIYPSKYDTKGYEDPKAAGQVDGGNKQVQDVIQALNDFLSPTYTALKFTMHEKLGEYYVQIIDEETKEVIREVPPKKMLDLYAAMAERIGLIINEKI